MPLDRLAHLGRCFLRAVAERHAAGNVRRPRTEAAVVGLLDHDRISAHWYPSESRPGWPVRAWIAPLRLRPGLGRVLDDRDMGGQGRLGLLQEHATAHHPAAPRHVDRVVMKGVQYPV